MASNVRVMNMEVKDGKVVTIGLSGDCLDLVTIAIGEVETAKANVKHMQRPLERKFTSIISKMRALQQDLKTHLQYVSDLEGRKQDRHQATLMKQWEQLSQTKKLSAILENLPDGLGDGSAND